MIKYICLWLTIVFGVKAQAQDFTYFVVDKAKFQLHQVLYKETPEIIRTYKVTLGKASGDKVKEGDLKTPEGFYRFTAKYQPPQIKKKFGAMALYMNYPNPIDKREGKTGFDIMLHSTDDPARLERPQDSDGCIVLNDQQVLEISQSVRTPYTPILVYENLNMDYLKPGYKPELQAAFDKWLKAWTSKDLDGYIGSYADDFRFENMDLKGYREYKGFLNKKYQTIDVLASDIRYYNHDKYSVVTFVQQYSSTFSNGKKAFVSTGTKAVYFKEINGQYKIIFEEFIKGA